MAATLTFHGTTITLAQPKRVRDDLRETPSGAPADNTGWCVWETANIMLRMIASDENFQAIRTAVQGPAAAGDTVHVAHLPHVQACDGEEPAAGKDALWWREHPLLDLSAGAGTLGIAAACAGSGTVVMADIGPQLEQLETNVQANGAAVSAPGALAQPAGAAAAGTSASIPVVEYWWAQPVDALRAVVAAPTRPSVGYPDKPYGAVVASDVIFIAVRDGLEDQLHDTLVKAATELSDVVLCAWEERLPDEEQAFLDALAASGSVRVTELMAPALELDQAHAMAGIQGATGEELVGSIFWEPPPIRCVAVWAPPAAAPA